jgi:hypothetical protein
MVDRASHPTLPTPNYLATGEHFGVTWYRSWQVSSHIATCLALGEGDQEEGDHSLPEQLPSCSREDDLCYWRKHRIHVPEHLQQEAAQP